MRTVDGPPRGSPGADPRRSHIGDMSVRSHRGRTAMQEATKSDA